MIRDLKHLYVAIKDHEVIFFATNLKKFVEGLDKRIKGVKSYSYYSKKFKETDICLLSNDELEVYYLQKVL